MTGESFAYRELLSGSEVEYVLQWRAVPYRAATRWEPEESGVELESVWIDGKQVQWVDVPEDVMDELVADAHEQCRAEVEYS